MTKFDNQVQVELTEHEWYVLMRMAHEQDITLNQLVNNILREYLDNIKKEQT